MGMRTVGVVLAVVLSSAAAQAGQAYGANRVRLTVQRGEGGGSRRIVGELIAQDAQSVTLRDQDDTRETVVKRSDVLKLEHSLGRRGRAEAALRCAAIGFGVGAVTGVAVGSLAGGQIAFEGHRGPHELGAYLGGVGAALGAANCAYGPGERWGRGTPDGPALALRPARGGLGLEAAIGF